MALTNSIKQNWGKLDESWRFAISAFLVARLFYAVWSWVILTIQPIAVHYIDVNRQPAVLFLDLYTIQQNTYLRSVNGIELNFRSASRNTVKDLQTSSTWDIHSGLALEGYFKGISLTSAPTPSNMFAYLNTKPYSNAWLGMWQRFDANWYISIAENGYGSIEGDVHFPPLYPLLIRLTIPIFGSGFLAGLVISQLATLCALKLLFNFFNQWTQNTGRETVAYFLIYPTSFFLFSTYTESLFIVVALLSLRAMHKRDWAWAGFWIFCSVLLRLQGIALSTTMLYLMWKDNHFLRKMSHWAGLIASGFGLLFYFLFRSTLITGSALPFVEPNLHARLVLPWETYLYAVRIIFSGRANHIDILNWSVATIFIILFITKWKKTPTEYNLYAGFTLLIILVRIVDGQPLISFSRYSLTLFPLFHYFALNGKYPVLRRLIIYTFLALNLFLSSEFFGWGFVA